jgi:imidazolonepropionase-like amidohydrolase
VQVIDVGGRTLMPGLIDAHVHALASDVAVARVEALGEA